MKPALIPFVDLWAQHEKMMPQFEAALRDVVRNSHFIRGPQLEEFEKAFATHHGMPHALGCASGTDALILAAKALDLKEGDEVISVSNTWISTIFAISMTGATPILVDIDHQTKQIDVAAAAKAITPRTRAIFAVHMYGHPADLTELSALCKMHNLFLVEDVAQATGAYYDGQLCGTVGDINCFSFFPSKNLGCLGDGGAILTRNDDLARRMRQLADYGQNPRFTHHEIGFNSRLDSLQAAFLSVKLRFLNDWVKERQRLAKRYNTLLGGFPIEIPYEHPKAQSAYHLYVIEMDRRDECHAFMHSEGIMTQIHYPKMVHLQPCYKDLGYERGDMPVTERSNDRILSLPIFPGLTDEQQDYIVATIKKFVSR